MREKKKSTFEYSALIYIWILILAVSMFLLTRTGPVKDFVSNRLAYIGFDFNGYGIWGLAALLFIVSIPIFFVLKRESKQGQDLRNQEATSEGDKAVYLRPFFSDLTIKFKNPDFPVFTNMIFPGSFPELSYISPGEFIYRVLEPIITVKVIGGNDDIPNPGMDDCLAGWKTKVEKEIQSAALVIILPMISREFFDGRILDYEKIYGEGTLHELKILSENDLMDKAIVIMPPSTLFKARSVGKSWEEARKRASEINVTLPSYNRKGGFMLIEKVEDFWQASELFGNRGIRRKRLAKGLIEALISLDEKMSTRYAEKESA